MATIATDRSTQLDAFEKTKSGVKGLVDSGYLPCASSWFREGIRGFQEQDNESKKRFYSRDHTKKLVYFSNVDLYTARAASWRDTLCCYMAPDPPTLEDLPAVCG